MDDQRRQDARLQVQQLRAFYVHVGVFAGSMVVIFLVNLVVNLAAGIAGEWSAWWSIWALLGWGLGVAVHGLVVWASRARILGSEWEDEQVDKILARSSQERSDAATA
jgi:hypothetical protein